MRDNHDRAVDAVKTIAIWMTKSTTDNPTLAAGNAGRALLAHYFDTVFPGCGYYELAQQHLEKASDSLESIRLSAHLLDGYVGVAFVVDHILGAAEDRCAEIDEELADRLADGSIDNPDLLTGLAGIGVYALQRAISTKNLVLIELVVRRLCQLSERFGNTVAWRIPAHHLPNQKRQEFGNGQLNLGVAHGVPAIVGVLAGAVGVGLDSAKRLYDSGLRWLLDQRIDGADGCFPATAGKAIPARHAWCYGDPGIAATLMAAGTVLNDQATVSESITIGRLAATRVETMACTSLSLCHGVAGLGHLFNRMWLQTGDPAMLHSAQRLFDDLLTRADDALRADDGSLLSGIVGIGLALLAAICPDAMNWDRLLVASLPTTREPVKKGDPCGSIWRAS